MERGIDILSIRALDQIPALESIISTPRERILKLIFDNEINDQRQQVGEGLKKALPEFQIGIHTIEPEIRIAKLITNKEIEENQEFFEKCAKDYSVLGKRLIRKLVDKLALNLYEDFPMQTFNELKKNIRSNGKVEGWNYYVHGFHCGFVNIKTKQEIEVSLVFGQEYGDLDPCFFSKFIKSTPEYRPLSVDIFEDYADGVRISEKMISLRKFEVISSNIGNHYGIVVADRQKTDIKPC